MKRLSLSIIMLVCLLLIYTTTMADIKEGLFLYLPFDEGKGTTVKDYSSNGYDGEIFDFDKMDWDDGKFGKALQMSAKGWENKPHAERLGRVEVDLGHPKELTISLWFNATKDISWNYFIFDLPVLGLQETAVRVSPLTVRVTSQVEITREMSGYTW